MNMERSEQPIVGGVDTHKDLHVAAVVDAQDQFIASESFATTRQGYRLMLEWMGSFGNLQRVGVEATGTYGAGVLRYCQKAGVEVLEVTGPDKHDRRARGKSDTFDAEAAAHAAFARKRTVPPKTRDGMVEALRVLKACRKTAVQAKNRTISMLSPKEVFDTRLHLTKRQYETECTAYPKLHHRLPARSKLSLHVTILRQIPQGFH